MVENVVNSNALSRFIQSITIYSKMKRYQLNLKRHNLQPSVLILELMIHVVTTKINIVTGVVAFKMLSSRYGIALVVISHNEPPLTCFDVKEFYKNWVLRYLRPCRIIQCLTASPNVPLKQLKIYSKNCL